MIKQLAKVFEGQFKCLGENAEKYITFLVPIKKGLDISKIITYKLNFIDSFRSMSTLLSSFADNLSEIYCKKYRDKNCKSACDFIGLKKNGLCYKCKECKKMQLEPINELIENFSNIHKFCNNDLNKFILLLRKGVYPYKYMDSWERFDEKSLSDKKEFYSEFVLEEVTDKDYTHAQQVFKELKLKKLEYYDDLYVQSGTLLLADVFEKFRNKRIEIYELDSANFFVFNGITTTSLFKKDKRKIRIINRY